ncbi:MAG: hypothetical protein ACREF1_00520, partial [Acetobacteraceae bacterium]
MDPPESNVREATPAYETGTPYAVEMGAAQLPRMQSPLLRKLLALDWSRVVMGLLGVVGIIVIWWLAALIISDNVILPSPGETGRTLLHYLTRRYPARGET